MKISYSAFLVAAVVLSACTSVQPYEKPIADFAASADVATKAVQQLDANATKRLTEWAADEAAKNTRAITQPNGDCLTGKIAKRCQLAVKVSPPGNGDDPQAYILIPLNATTLIPNSVRISTAVQSYAKALGELAKADASADVKAGLGSTVGAAAKLAGMVGLPEASVLGAIATPLTDAGTWLFQQYQNSMKLEALQRATAAADPSIQKAMKLLAEEFAVGEQSELAHLRIDYLRKFSIVESEPKATPSQIAALGQSASLLDTALKVRKEDVFTKLAKAHGMLTRELANPEPNFEQVAAAVQNLITGVEAIKKLTDAYDKAQNELEDKKAAATAKSKKAASGGK